MGATRGSTERCPKRYYCTRAAAGGRRGPITHSGANRVLLKVLIALIVVVLVGGVVFLATWDIPAPTQQVEKVIPDDRFPR